jgi:hypothetical protein
MVFSGAVIVNGIFQRRANMRCSSKIFSLSWRKYGKSLTGIQSGKLTIPLLLLFAVCFPALSTHAKYGGGTGGSNDPYLIFDANQMNAIGADQNDWNKHFKLMADIDLAAFTGTSFNMIGYFIDYHNLKPFSGIFDGNNNTIANFTYESSDSSYIGLFGCIGQYGAQIKDLRLIDPNVNAGTAGYVGSLVGHNYSGTVINCRTQGGSVSGSSRIGGLVGFNSGTILNSFADCNVSGTGGYVGGLVGYNYMGTILSCYSSGDVKANANCVGGLAGYSGWIVSQSYTTGSVSGQDNVGGLVGYNELVIYSTPSGTVADCYAVGPVSGINNVGGLVGINDGGYVSGSFWDTQTTLRQTSDGGMPRTTAEMQDPNTFLDYGWDFVGEYENGPNDDWAEPLVGGYPVLSWQLGESLPLPAFSGGSGTPDDPYLISTPADLSRIGHNPRLMNAHFKLTDDVNMADTTHFIIGNGLYPFAGTFDGGGHVVSNFYRYARTGEMSKGLFGIVNGTGAEIKNLGLTDSSISGGGYQKVGLLVGMLSKGTVTGCFAERGSISVFESDGGGLVGSNYGTISNCYANVNVSGWFGVGGLVEMNSGIISNCYSRGRVDGQLDYGGLVSRSNGGVTNSFWDVNSSGGIGLTTTEMQTISTFTNAGWDFVGETANGTEFIWRLCQDLVDYPRLAWEFNLADFVCPDGVEMRDYAVLAAQWRQFPNNPSADIAPEDGDSRVDGSDLAALVNNWLQGLDH